MENDVRLKNLKSWPKGVSGNPKGRPKKIYTILKEKGYSKDDIRTAFGELLFYTPQELEILEKQNNVPSIVLIVAKAIKRAIYKGDYSIIKDIMEQTVGRATLDIKTFDNAPPKKIEIEIIKA